jgi:RNA polymerase sigma-70 factor (ECF subfamily)
VLAQCRSGDWHAYGELVARYQRLVRAAVDLGQDEHSLADLVQETFIRAYEKLHLFRGQGSFSSWLYPLARNHALNARRGVRLPSLALDGLHSVKSEGAQPAEMYLDDSRQRLLRRLIGELPAREHEPLARHYFLAQSYEQIAAELNMPVNTVRTHIHRAKQRLRDGARRAGWNTGDWE